MLIKIQPVKNPKISSHDKKRLKKDAKILLLFHTQYHWDI